MQISKQKNIFFTATLLVRVIYFLFGRSTFQLLNNLDEFSRSPRLKILWPLGWARSFSTLSILEGIVIASFVAFFLGLLWPGKRLVRALIAYCYLCQLIVEFTYGNVGYANHAFFWILFIFALAPTWNADEEKVQIRQRMLLNFFFAQFAIGLFYFLAGLGKVIVAIEQLFNGQISTLHWTGMSRLMAQRLYLGNTTTVFGPFFIENPKLNFISYWATVAIELCGIWVVFRPRYHQAWALSLIFFHIAVALSLGPSFSLNVLVLSTLFLLSPFALAKVGNYGWDFRLVKKFKKGFQTKS